MFLLGAVVVGSFLYVVLGGELPGSRTTNPRDVSIPRGPSGTKSFDEQSRRHVPGTVRYAVVPPVGGDHAPIWLNCGFYDKPVAPELAVHSLEHGAVWITYETSIPGSHLMSLRRLIGSLPVQVQRYVILSPFQGLSAPIVASAWRRQLEIDAPTDRRLTQFINSFAGGPQAPEPGFPCAGGLGQPVG
jgi:hypothetical protein